jgi:hypothetical protein
MDKKNLSESNIRTMFITPTLRKAGWDEKVQIREEVTFTTGRIIVSGKLVGSRPSQARRHRHASSSNSASRSPRIILGDDHARFL